MSDAKWYVVHTYSGYENKVKANIDKTIENRHLEDQILEVRVPMQEVVELKNGVQKASQKKPNTPLEASHIMMPLVTTPSEMAQKAGRSFICSRVAMRQPVQAPVPGRGTATNRKSPSIS